MSLIDSDGAPLTHRPRCTCDNCILTWEETPDQFYERITEGMTSEERDRFDQSASLAYYSSEYQRLTEQRAAYREARP